jgi:hypothetical protein
VSRAPVPNEKAIGFNGGEIVSVLDEFWEGRESSGRSKPVPREGRNPSGVLQKFLTCCWQRQALSETRVHGYTVADSSQRNKRADFSPAVTSTLRSIHTVEPLHRSASRRNPRWALQALVRLPNESSFEA